MCQDHVTCTLNNLDSWASSAGLKFNEKKCKAQSITRKRNPVSTTYTLKGTPLENTSSERDLGVWVTDNLTWTKQVAEQSAKANKLLGYVRRNRPISADVIVYKCPQGMSGLCGRKSVFKMAACTSSVNTKKV